MTKKDMNAYKNDFNPKPFDLKEHQHHHKSSKNDSKPPEGEDPSKTKSKNYSMALVKRTGRDPNTSSSHHHKSNISNESSNRGKQVDNGDNNAARSQNSQQQDQSQSQAVVPVNHSSRESKTGRDYDIDESIRQGLLRRNMSLKEYDQLLGDMRRRQGKAPPGKGGKRISKDKLRMLPDAIRAAKRNKNRTHSNRTGSNRTGSSGNTLQGKPAANNTKKSNTGGDSPLAKTGGKHRKHESPEEVARLKKRLERYNEKQKKKGTFECKDRGTKKNVAKDRCAKIKKKRACNHPNKAGVYARYRYCMVTCGTCTPSASKGHSPKKGKGKKA
ncbi:hypothetical protein Ddc_13062 [Ditylenchus destructor]|nr:hypothetical protein Ddc_13062 [Ditylenchus destructor]